jgi:hypothetical protein
MLQSWGTSTLSHDASLYSGRSAPAFSPAQNLQAESNDWTWLAFPSALTHSQVEPARRITMTNSLIGICKKGDMVSSFVSV